ncbi:gluconokinase [Mucilaginibacter sp.]|uniref:gluconokinase n=1 Tax=Mucilaginibacter sp. TaxID=1882438 RepID=UPI0035BC70DA
MQKYFVGIDLGTGSTKAVALDTNGIVLCLAQHYYPTINLQPGYSEQNPCLIWDAFVLCVNEVTAKLGCAPSFIGFSAAMHSIMPVNDAGEPLANALLWADSRSGEIAQAIRSSAQGEDIYRHTGTAIYAMSPLCKLIWLRDNEPDLLARAHKFISIKEFIWFKLFGVFEVDHSIASATGMLDILNREWYAPSLSLAGITTDKLSTPVSTKYYRYLTARNDTLPMITNETAFVIGASDGCCANLGGNAVTPGTAALTIGTSGAVRTGSTRPVYNYGAMTFNYILDEQIFICGGAVNNGGAALDWVIKEFLKYPQVNDDIYRQVFSEIATAPAGSDGLIFLPYLYAERAPVWDAKSSAAFLNISFKHQRQHFLRAALEGICYALNDVLCAVEQSSQPIEQIVISGGFVSSQVWVQMLADITGKLLVLQQAEDASAIGAIYLGLQAFGENVQKVTDKGGESLSIIMPDAVNYQVYNRVFAIYQKLYKNLKESMHLMHGLDISGS